jgi:hypothetical protein
MVIRLALLAIFVGAVGVFTGTIKPAKIWSHVPTVPAPPHRDLEGEYLQMVDGNFNRIEPLSSGFFRSCGPGPAHAGECSVLADQVLNALRVFQGDLRRAEVPPSLADTDASLRRFASKGVEAFTAVKQAVRTQRSADWRRARRLVAQAGTLLDRANAALPATAQP